MSARVLLPASFSECSITRADYMQISVAMRSTENPFRGEMYLDAWNLAGRSCEGGPYVVSLEDNAKGPHVGLHEKSLFFIRERC